jgi:hypothetical protein
MFVPEGTMELAGGFPVSLQDMISSAMHQTRCVWLISGCPFGTKIVPPKFDDGGSEGAWVMAGLRNDVQIKLCPPNR